MRISLMAIVFAMVLAGALGNVACKPNLAPVYAPASPAGLTLSGTPYAAEQVEVAAMQGAVAQGWVVVQRTPGIVIAEINSKGHGARVRILVNEGGWRIVHESSSPSMKYTQDPGQGELIHHHYNLWIKRLDVAIRRALATPTAGGYVAPPPPPSAVPAPTVVEPAAPAAPAPG